MRKKIRETLYRKKYGKSSSEEIREIGTIQFTFASGRGKRKSSEALCYTVQRSRILQATRYQTHSVPDPSCLIADPDPRIRTTGLRIRILLFSSVAFKTLTKN